MSCSQRGPVLDIVCARHALQGCLKIHPRGRENGTTCPFGVFSPFSAIFGPICSEANCDLVTFSLVCLGISGGVGVLEPRTHHLSFSGPKGKCPFQAPKTLRMKGEKANFEAKNSIKAKRDKWFHFHTCTPPPAKFRGERVSELKKAGVEKYRLSEF